jgi:hypothetical protein
MLARPALSRVNRPHQNPMKLYARHAKHCNNLPVNNLVTIFSFPHESMAHVPISVEQSENTAQPPYQLTDNNCKNEPLMLKE